MFIEDILSQQEPTYKEYTILKEQGDKLIESIKDAIRSVCMKHIWATEYEQMLFDARVKSHRGTKIKVDRCSHPSQDFSATVKNDVDDFVGARLVVPTSDYLPLIAEAVLGEKSVWIASDPVLYTTDAKEEEPFEHLRIRTDRTKDSGYTGLHFVIVKNDVPVDEIRRFELQVRTSFQHSWQTFEHPFYKVQDALKIDEHKLRPAIAMQIKAAEKEAEYTIKKFKEAVAQKRQNDPAFTPPSALVDWRPYGTPRDYVGKIIRPEGLPNLLQIITGTETRLSFSQESTAAILLGEDWKSQVKELHIEIVATHFAHKGTVENELQDPAKADCLKRLVRSANSVQALSGPF